MSLGQSLKSKERRDVIIIGGSISGLMHGIMLKSLGQNVHILEQQDSARSDYGAGIATGPDGKRFLEEFGLSPTVTGTVYDCPGYNALDQDNRIVGLTSASLTLTSWTALYYQLRMRFDGLPSAFCKALPPASILEKGGSTTFHTKKRVLSVTSDPSHEGLLAVEYEDTSKGDAHRCVSVLYAHLVIDAGGPYSSVRSTLIQVKPRYAGFVAWRGTVLDAHLSEETKLLFRDMRVNILPMEGGNYCLAYVVPGENGSLHEEERQVSWIWYSTKGQSELEQILTDRDGYTHANSIPRGKLNLQVWTKHREAISPKLNRAFSDLMLATSEPFVSAIQESFLPTRARSFFDGRLLLVGEGSNLMRPTGGQATNNAAMQCFALRDLLQRKMTLSEWETVVADQGWQMRLFSRMIGDRFLYGTFWALLAAARLRCFGIWMGLKACLRHYGRS